MTAIDVFCSADDRHRVILLVNLLERAGCDVTLRSDAARRDEALARPTDPCLVAVTRRSLRERWLETLFTEAPNVAAMRLDDSPLPWPCGRIIDMQTWPARSADSKVASLVQWLQLRQQPGEAVIDGVQLRAGAGDHPGTAGGGSGLPKGRRVRLRVRAGDKASHPWSGLLMLGALTAAAYLLFLAAPEPGGQKLASVAAPPEDAMGAAYQPPIAHAASELAPAPRREAGSPPGDPGRVGGNPQGSAALPPRTQATAMSDSPTTAQPLRASLPPSRSDTGARPAVDTGSILPPRRRRDALAHLCQARTPEAALAWAGALDWKQRRRLPEEPCVEALLQRPGFQGLAGQL